MLMAMETTVGCSMEHLSDANAPLYKEYLSKDTITWSLALSGRWQVESLYGWGRKNNFSRGLHDMRKINCLSYICNGLDSTIKPNLQYDPEIQNLHNIEQVRLKKIT